MGHHLIISYQIRSDLLLCDDMVTCRLAPADSSTGAILYDNSKPIFASKPCWIVLAPLRHDSHRNRFQLVALSMTCLVPQPSRALHRNTAGYGCRRGRRSRPKPCPRAAARCRSLGSSPREREPRLIGCCPGAHVRERAPRALVTYHLPSSVVFWRVSLSGSLAAWPLCSPCIVTRKVCANERVSAAELAARQQDTTTLY